MRKQIEFRPVSVKNQNELIDAIDREEGTIIYDGNSLGEIGKKLKKERGVGSAAKFFLPAGLLSVVNPVFGALSVFAGALVAIGSGSVLLHKDKRFDKYNVFFLSNNPSSHSIGFVLRKEYNVAEDVVIYSGANIKLTPDFRCPVCKKRLEKGIVFGRCKKCSAIVSFMAPISKIKLDKM
ncbi:MAG: hypothetical protein IKB79_01455 [Oscillospiraceae bacterium]|nr:hypothetical protein [Oscillospiraceae bacterium]